ncbi:MAG: hypothetical protein ACYCS1_10025 [Gammaproteobacteria bacterium]
MGEWILVILVTIDFLTTLLRTTLYGSNPSNKGDKMTNSLHKKLAEKIHWLMASMVTKIILLVLELGEIHPHSHADSISDQEPTTHQLLIGAVL